MKTRVPYELDADDNTASGDDQWRGPLVEDVPALPLAMGVFLAIAVVGFALAGLLL